MRDFSSVMCWLLAGLALTSAQAGDSLKSAIEAVSRRQLDLGNSDPRYFSLASYRYPKENEQDMPFLTEGRDFNEDGQPENIGYGFQKSVGSQLSPENEQDLLTELALEYLESEVTHDNDDGQFYPTVNEAEKKSVFRERDLEPRKRGPLTTSFRERAHSSEETENQRQHLAESLLRKVEEEEAEEEEREYERVIGNLLERYGGPGRNDLDVGKLSTKELGELLQFLGENGAPVEDLEEIRSEVEKRYGGGGSYSTGYDFFNNGAMMNGGFGYKKRSKQQLEDADAAENAFLFSLKFVSPELNREAVEQMREYEGIDPAGENDFDVLKLNMKYNSEDEKARAEGWLPVVENPEREDFENPNPQGLIHSHDISKKPNKLSKHHNVLSEYVLPEHNIDKKFLYDRALLKRKRFPVSKRSSNYYTSPPLLHHHVAGERKKKDTPEAHSTDPKVASEISHIFSSSNEEASNESVKSVPQIIGNHVVSKQRVVTDPTPSLMTTEATQFDQHNQSVSEEEVELPVTMSRLELPIQVKKKSIDWSDYFGLDRRRKKIGPNPRNAVDENWLMNQYYRPLALSDKKYKKTIASQPFDTRIFGADIFQRNEAKKSRGVDADDAKIEKMDSKLKTLEDIIVNEALKYTGAHQGVIDSKEVQQVKDKVLARLQAAYNLEKMRKALGEFKSSLAAQKASKYNTELDKKKRVAVKKERPEKDKKRAEEFGNIMPEVYPDNRVSLDTTECPILPNIAKKCQVAVGRHEQLLPLCALHQICYICGWDGDSQPPVACDGMFAHKAEEVCAGETSCGEAAVQVILELTGRLPTDVLASTSPQCWPIFCSEQPSI